MAHKLQFVVERDAAGLPVRLVWSPEIQRAAEQHLADMQRQRVEEQRARERPAPWIEEWLAKRGIAT